MYSFCFAMAVERIPLKLEVRPHRTAVRMRMSNCVSICGLFDLTRACHGQRSGCIPLLPGTCFVVDGAPACTSFCCRAACRAR